MRMSGVDREEARAMDELADIGATDTDGGDPHLDLARSRIRDGKLLEPDIARPVIPDCPHTPPFDSEDRGAYCAACPPHLQPGSAFWVWVEWAHG